MSLIFISHSSKDNPVAEKLRERLEGEGHASIFLDIDPEDGIGAGRDWEQELYRKIRGCRAVVVLCSEHSMASKWCFMEITHARALGKHLFPIKIDDCQIDGVLTDRQVIDLTRDEEQGYRRLFDGILAAGLDPADAFDWDRSRSPYPGLLAFQAADAAVFFGRDAEIGEGLDLLHRVRRLGETGLVMVLGASGTGKSSLVRAGLLPRLGRDPERWLIVDPFRPRDDPARELAAVASRAYHRLGRDRSQKDIRECLVEAMGGTAVAVPDRDQPDDATREQRFLDLLRVLETTVPTAANPRIRRYLRLVRGAAEETAPVADEGSSDANGMIELATDLRLLGEHSEAKVLWVIDQFEELLGHEADHPASRFLELLRAAVEHPATPLLVLGTMRSDFLGQFQRNPALLDVRYQTLSLGPMSREDIAQIIEKPAEVASIDLEPGLVQALITDAETEDALPLLAFTLRELNERFGDDWLLEVDEYQRQLGGLQGAVAKAADDVLDAEPPGEADQEKLRTAFLAMVRVSEDGSYARRPTRWDELPAEVHPLLEKFVQARLLVSSGDGDERTLEVAHEALFRSWRRLRGWLTEDRELLLWRRRLAEARREWQRHQHHPTALLTGPALLEGRSWLERRAVRLGAEEMEFLQKSVAAREKKARRKRAMWAGVGVFLAVAAIVGLALWRRAEAAAEDARRQTVIAEAAALAARDQARVAVASQWLEKDATISALVLLELEGEQADELPILSTMSEALRQSIAVAEWTGHQGAVDAAAYSPSGDRIVTAGEDRRVRVWRADGSGESTVLDGHEGWVNSAAFDRAGDRIVSASSDRTVRIWNADGTGEPVILTHPDEVYDADFEPSGGRVVTGAKDGVVRLWSADGGDDPMEWAGHDGVVESVGFDPSGDRIVSTSQDWTVRLWDADGDVPPIVFAGHRDHVYSAAFSPSGDRIVSASRDNTARVWNVDGSGDPLVLSSHRNNVTGAVFLAEDRILTVSFDGTFRVWAADSGESSKVSRFGEGLPFEVDASPSGERFVTALHDGSIRIWSTQDGAEPRILAHGSSVRSAVYLPGGERVATAAKDGSVRLWDLADGEPAVLRGSGVPVVDLAASPDGARIAVARENGVVEVLGVDGQGKTELRHEGGVTSVAYDPRGERIVTGGDDAVVRVWSSEGGGEPLLLPGHEGRIRGVAFDPSGDRIVSASEDHTSRIWQLEGGGDPLVLRHAAEVHDAVFSPSGDRVATASKDTVVRIWKLDDLESPLTLRGHDRPVISVAFSPTGDRVVSSSHGNVRIWDSRELGDPLVRRGHRNWVRSAVFSPDGEEILSGSWDRTARIWAVSYDRLADRVRGSTRACLTPTFRQRTLGEGRERAEREARACRECLEAKGDLGSPFESYRRCLSQRRE